MGIETKLYHLNDDGTDLIEARMPVPEFEDTQAAVSWCKDVMKAEPLDITKDSTEIASEASIVDLFFTVTYL